MDRASRKRIVELIVRSRAGEGVATKLFRSLPLCRRLCVRRWLPIACLLAPLAATGQEALREVLLGGKFDLSLRLRYEAADDAAPGLKRAHASTLRSAVGYTSGSWRGFNAYLQIEDVQALGNDSYNDGGSNGVTDRAAIVDPQGTEINQAFLRFGGLPRTVMTLGRQDLTHREAPLHRFLGNVGFRQNTQSFDALRIQNLSLPKTTLDYAYLWNANRIFGRDHPNPDVRDFRMHSHALNVQYSGFARGKLKGYAYLLDFDGAAPRRFSSATAGARFQGNHVATPKLRLTYALEAALQTDYADNPDDIRAHYALAEITARHTLGATLESVSYTAGYELLSGDGGADAFQTPLGTNHAFQGAADRFLVTPGDGIRDAYLRLQAKLAGVQLGAEYHDFRADRDGYRYGGEWDFIIEKTLAQRVTIGAQYADYQAQRNARNTARNSASGQAFDLTRFWLYAQFRY